MTTKELHESAVRHTPLDYVILTTDLDGIERRLIWLLKEIWRMQGKHKKIVNLSK